MARTLASMALSWVFINVAGADDWNQFRGPNRDSVWSEKGLPDSFPEGSPKIVWRVPAGGGFSSPVVARGRVYVADSEREKPRAWERVRCFDEKTGAVLWAHRYEVDYADWAFDPKQSFGPGATPVVHEGRVYTVGSATHLLCLDAGKGTVLWQRNLVKDYDLERQMMITPSPLVEGGLVIVVIGGKAGAGVVAFDRDSGKEVWRALDDPWTYSSPIVVAAGGKRQLIVWTGPAVTSLDPATGKTHWREALETRRDYVVVSPVAAGDLLLVGGLMFRLDREKPAAAIVWPERRASPGFVLSQTSMPLIRGDHIYTDKSGGTLACLEAATGKEVWQTKKVTEARNGACMHLTPNGDSTLLFTDQGMLIRARLSPKGYEELGRFRLIEPTYPYAGRNVVWPPPAYANRHVFARSDREMICVSLAATP